MGKSGIFIALALGALIAFVVFLPSLRQWWLKVRSEEVTISYPSNFQEGSGAAGGASGGTETQRLRIVTVLGRDGIPAILAPEFIDANAALLDMSPDERVLGLSLNGDHRAYPLNLLSRHEIVNDTVGGVPVAVTW